MIFLLRGLALPAFGLLAFRLVPAPLSGRNLCLDRRGIRGSLIGDFLVIPESARIAQGIASLFTLRIVNSRKPGELFIHRIRTAYIYKERFSSLRGGEAGDPGVPIRRSYIADDL